MEDFFGKILFIIKINNMKTKKLLSVAFLLLLIANFISATPNINAMQILEGATIKTANNHDVYSDNTLNFPILC